MTKKQSLSKLTEIAQRCNLGVDRENLMAFGYYSGYNLAISQMLKAGNFLIFMNLENSTEKVSQIDFNDFKEKTEKIVQVHMKANGSVAFETAISMGAKGTFENFFTALNSLVAYLHSKGLQNCCYICSDNKITSSYALSQNAFQLCDNCCTEFANKVNQSVTAQEEKKEKVALGVIGAILGSLVGVASIIIFSQLGYVSAFSGLIMAVGTLKGYEILAGKITKKGIVISLLLMIIMTVVGHHLDWAVYIMQELKLDLLTAFENVSLYINPDDYRNNLLMLALFALLGSGGAVISAFKDQAKAPKLVKLSN